MLSIIMLIASCSNEDLSTSNIDESLREEVDGGDAENANKHNLGTVDAIPETETFTLEDIEIALDEYINYILWNDPITNLGGEAPTNSGSTISFNPYIDKTIDVEVRDYDGNLYASIGINEWLAIFKTLNESLYCVGLTRPNQYDWPDGDYIVVGSFQMEVAEPRKPNYGSSPYKDQLLVAARENLQSVCEDLHSGEGSEEWIGAQAHIVDFFEYQDGTTIVLIKDDGYAWIHPIYFDERNDAIVAVGMKGYGMDNVDQLPSDDLGRFFFELLMDDIIEIHPCEGKNEI